MQTIKSRIDNAGRLVIPNHYRRALHLKPGEEVMLRISDGELHVCSFKDAASKARDLIATYNKDNKDLLNLLFEMRREDNSSE